MSINIPDLCMFTEGLHSFKSSFKPSLKIPGVNFEMVKPYLPCGSSTA